MCCEHCCEIESKISEKSENTCACCEERKLALHNADSVSSYDEIMKLLEVELGTIELSK